MLFFSGNRINFDFFTVFLHDFNQVPATSHRPTTTAPLDDAVVVTGVFEPALSVQQLAEELHVSAQTIYDLRSQGRGPTGFRVGRHLRFRKSEIEAWLARLEGEDSVRHPGGEAR